jgi:cysteine desulfurase/selenocysteine lyase
MTDRADQDALMPLDMAALRRSLPHLDSCLYFNTAGAGLSWPGQGAAAARFYDIDKANGYDGRDRWHAVYLSCREQLAHLLRVPAEAVSFASSASEAINLVAGAIRLQPGDQVVHTEDEFPSVALAWQNAAEQDAEVIRVPVRTEAERTDALIAAIGPRSRIVCVSHVHWCTGTRVDLQRIAVACRAHGARLIVDGVQALGAVEVDASVADFYTASVFKWLLSGFGLAVMITRADFAQTLHPRVRGYNNEPPATDLRYSHLNYPGLYALHATLEYLESLGWTAIFSRVEQLSRRLHERLTAAGWRVVTPLEARAGIISIALPNAVDCTARLARLNVRVEERAGLIRASPHFYNTTDEVDRFVELLSACAP